MKTANAAAILGLFLIGAHARAGTVTVAGDQTVAGSQLVQSNQTVAGALTSQGASAEVAATRFRAFGSTDTDRWIKIARIGGADLTNAVVAGRVLAQGYAPGQQYVADFAFPGTGQSPYSPVLVEMGEAGGFWWAVCNSGDDKWLWFRQPANSRFANFLYGQAGCEPVWEVMGAGTPPGVFWSSTTPSLARQRIKAGGMTLTSGLTLPDGTLLSARSNMTATALINPANPDQKLAEVTGGKLVFSAAPQFVSGIGLGNSGVAVTAERWAAVESTAVAGAGARDIGGTAPWAIAGMADDADGNRYAYGYFAGSMRAGATVLPSGASENDRAGFVIRIDPVGRVAWARAFPLVDHSPNGTQNEPLVQIARGAVDASGNVVLAGTFRATADFAGTTNSPSGGGDGFVVSLDRQGVPLWFRRFGGAESGADTFVDLAVDAAGTAVVAAGAKAVSGGTEGRVVMLSASDGAPQGEWDVMEAATHACFSGASAVAAHGTSVSKLGTGGWVSSGASATGELIGTPSGDVLVFQPDRDGMGGVVMLDGATGTEEWSEIGFANGTSSDEPVLVGYDEYQNPIYENQHYESASWSYSRGVAVDAQGSAWLSWEQGDSSSASGPLYNYSYSNQYYQIGRRGGDFVDLGHPFVMGADASGDIHALAHVDGKARDVRFDGGTGAQESDSRVNGAGGDLLAASRGRDSLVVAGTAGIGQLSDWDSSVSVDGVVAAEGGILLGDGTLVGSASDIAALGPVQSGAGGSYFLMGNVGIGTDAPTHGLDVVGDAYVGGLMTLGDGLTVAGALNGASGALSGNLAVAGNLTVTNDLTVLGNSDLARVQPKGDVPMGAFTNGPAQ